MDAKLLERDIARDVRIPHAVVHVLCTVMQVLVENGITCEPSLQYQRRVTDAAAPMDVLMCVAAPYALDATLTGEIAGALLASCAYASLDVKISPAFAEEDGGQALLVHIVFDFGRIDVLNATQD